jgi:hypothetical protein
MQAAKPPTAVHKCNFVNWAPDKHTWRVARQVVQSTRDTWRAAQADRIQRVVFGDQQASEPIPCSVHPNGPLAKREASTSPKAHPVKKQDCKTSVKCYIIVSINIVGVCLYSCRRPSPCRLVHAIGEYCAFMLFYKATETWNRVLRIFWSKKKQVGGERKEFAKIPRNSAVGNMLKGSSI